MTPSLSRNAKRESILDQDSDMMRMAIIAVAVILVYLNSLSGVFLFDDDGAIVNNVAIHNLWAFDWFAFRGRPVTTLTLAINYAIGGLDPIGYHVVNVVIHIINSLLLYWVIAAAIEASEPTNGRSPRSFAFASALLWAVHPLCTQSVTYVIQRSESLAAMGILATLFCWSMASRLNASTGWSIAAFVSSMIAYGSKESAAFLPIILLLYDRIFFSRSWHAVKRRAIWHAAVGLPVLVGACIYAVAFLGGQHQDPTVGFSMGRITPWTYFASQPFVFLQYLWLSVLPIEQTLDYGWLPSENRFLICLGLLLWVGIILSATWMIFRKPPIGFICWACLLILAPSSSFMPLQDIIFEHRVYLPLASICLMFVYIWDRAGKMVSSRFGVDIGRWQILAGVAVVVALGSLTIIRNRDYFSSEQMFATDVARNPDNPRALANLADASNFEHADHCIAMYVKALELYERRGFFYAGTQYKLTRAIADIYFLTGRPKEASIYYFQALEGANDVLQEAEVHFSLAMIASANGEATDADRQFALALDKADTLPGLQEAYAVHLRRTGREFKAAKAEEINGVSRRSRSFIESSSP